MTSTPVRINQDLYEAAQKLGAEQMRTTAEQINYLVRVGLEVEHSMAASTTRRAGAGDPPYDSLTAIEQAIVRARWDGALQADNGGIDLTDVLAATGADFLVEADQDGATAITRSHGPS